MISSVRQTSNKGRLKQVLDKNEYTIDESCDLEIHSTKMHVSQHLGTRALCSPYALSDLTPTSMFDDKIIHVKWNS